MLIVVTPGPDLFLLLGTAPGNGKLAGFFAMLGVCAAILSHAALVGVGVSRSSCWVGGCS